MPGYERSKERKSNRLKFFDYKSEQFYFVTVCTYYKNYWLGEVKGGKFIDGDISDTVRNIWMNLKHYYKDCIFDEFCIMPNHFHGIIGLGGGVGLSQVVASLKSFSTREINKFDNEFNFKWQKSFYDRVIRNELELKNIRNYISGNVLKWSVDVENAKNQANKQQEYYNAIINKGERS